MRIKSLDWYNKNKDIAGDIRYISGPEAAKWFKIEFNRLQQAFFNDCKKNNLDITE